MEKEESSRSRMASQGFSTKLDENTVHITSAHHCHAGSLTTEITRLVLLQVNYSGIFKSCSPFLHSVLENCDGARGAPRAAAHCLGSQPTNNSMVAQKAGYPICTVIQSNLKTCPDSLDAPLRSRRLHRMTHTKAVALSRTSVMTEAQLARH